ncbi:MAG: hypothetical protein QM535_16155 [Limnohabitans sp.]|nr:hypothetical protein [Limnohabitans sp.]
MNTSKFSLADTLIIIGALIFGFLCFLSINFLTQGDTNTSLIKAVIISLILFVLAFGAKLLKSTSRNFKTCIIIEWFFILLFIMVAYIAMSPFSQYFVVASQKDIIQNKAVSNITQAETLFKTYENYADNRKNLYKSRLNSIIAAKIVNPEEYINFGFVDGTDDKTQVENKLFTLNVQLYPSNYSEMKRNDLAWLIDAKNKVTNWAPISIVKVVNTLKAEILSWYKQLKSYSTFRAQGETATDFDFPISFDDVSGRFTKNSNPNPLALVIGIGLYLLMLLSYFITNRHTRFPGWKVIFCGSGGKLNQL